MGGTAAWIGDVVASVMSMAVRGEPFASDGYELLGKCESPIETDMLRAMLPWFSPGYLRSQVSCETRFGAFRFDFVLQRPGYTVVVECDGREFHDEWRDEWRDAITLGDGHADEVIRFPGSMIFHSAIDCALLLSEWHPWALTERGADAFDRLSTRWQERSEYSERLHVTLDGEPPHTHIVTRRRRVPGMFPMWERLHEFSVTRAPCSLDRLIADEEEQLKQEAKE
jgi:hypothetical protein